MNDFTSIAALKPNVNWFRQRRDEKDREKTLPEAGINLKLPTNTKGELSQYERSNTFNFEEFKKIPTKERMLIDLQKKLPVLMGGKGEGSSRIVFELTPKTVIKIAYGVFGLYQNRKEVEIQGKSAIFTRIYDVAPDMIWLVSEKVIPFNSEQQFKDKAGFDLEILFDINDIIKDNNTIEVTKDYIKSIYKLDDAKLNFIFNIYKVMQEEDLLKGDVLDPMHWGTSVIDGRLKLFDYGADRVLKEKAEALKEKMLKKQKEMLSKKEDDAAEGIYVYDDTDEDFERTSKSTYDIKQAYRINKLVKIAQSVLNLQTAVEPQSLKYIKEIEQKQDEDEYEEFNDKEEEFNLNKFKNIKQKQRKKFNLDKFKSLTTEESLLKYARKTLKQLSGGKGLGSSRYVFDLGNNKVLKIGYGSTGVKQNTKEAKTFPSGNFFTKIYEVDPKMKWIIAEKVKPFSSNQDFISHMGFDPKIINEFRGSPLNNKFKQQIKEKYNITDSAFDSAKELFDDIKNSDLLFGDSIDPTQWGISVSDGKPKLFDYGADYTIFENNEKIKNEMKNQMDEMLNNRERMTVKATKYDHLLKLANWFTNTVDNIYMNFDQPANKEKVEIILKDNGLWPIKSSDFWAAHTASKADSMKDRIILVISKDMTAKFESSNQAVADYFNKHFSMLLTRISGVLKTILSRGTYKNENLDIMFSKPEKDIVLNVI